jgi:hypothetical protein
MYNIPQHNLRNEALMLRDFHINSPYGRLGKHPPQGRWEGYVENFQYNQAFGKLTNHLLQANVYAGGDRDSPSNTVAQTGYAGT